MDRLTWLGQNRARGGTGGRPPASNQHETAQPQSACPRPADGGGGRRHGRGHSVRPGAVRRPRLRSRARSPGGLRPACRRVPWHRRGPTPWRGTAALDPALSPRWGNPQRGGGGVPGPAARIVALRRAAADHVSDGHRRSQPPGSRDRLTARLSAVLLDQGGGTGPLRAHLGMLERRPAGGPGPPLRGGRPVATSDHIQDRSVHIPDHAPVRRSVGACGPANTGCGRWLMLVAGGGRCWLCCRPRCQPCAGMKATGALDTQAAEC
jgi:hypothetical protein